MTQIVPGLPPLENLQTQPGDPSMGRGSPSFAEWLRSAIPAGRSLPEGFGPGGAAVALPDIAEILNEDGLTLDLQMSAGAITTASASYSAHDTLIPAVEDNGPAPAQPEGPVGAPPGAAMIEIAPGLPPLEYALAEPAACGPASDAPGHANWPEYAAPAGHALAESSAADGTAIPLSALAKVFNQEGFFGASLQTGAKTIEIATVAEPQMGRASLPLAHPAAHLDARAAPIPPATSAIANRHSALSSASATRLAPLPRAVMNSVRMPPAQTGEVAEAALPPESELQPDAPAQGAAPRLPTPAAQARAALRIAIRDLERGLQIVVAANALDAQERDRLTSEIAGLLSRHGLLPGDVRVTGVAQGQTRRNG